MSHHILNHISDDTGFTVGEGIGILLGLAIIGDDDFDEDSATLEDMTDLIGLTKNIGGAFDRPQYSRSQESEADFLSIQILDDAGYSLSKAKQGLINIAASAEDTSSRAAFLGTHPSGPQRLAIFNNNMQPSSRSNLASKIYSWCLEQSSWMQQNYNCNQYLKVRSTNSQERKPIAKPKERSGFDWDQIYYLGNYIWMCREIKTRLVWSDVNCNGIPKKDDRWPSL